MFLKLNERVYLNSDRITRIKIDEVQDGIRVRFYEENTQVAKSQRFNTIDDANKWLKELLKK
ncbi:MAG: sodium-dependent tyrosine transporter [Campylobacteraceae bacterium]